jgi:hypothetical protein
MFGMRHPQKRKRTSAIAVESLEDRVVLSAAVAEVEIQYLRAINHLDGILQGHVNRVTSTLTRQVSRLDAQYEATLSRTASRMNSGSVAEVQKARVDLSRASARVDQLVVKVDQQDNVFTASFDRQFAGVTGRYGRLNATIRSANPYFQATFQGALNSINGTVAAEAQGAQAAVQGTTSLVDAAIAQAGTAGTPAVSVADVASSQLAVDSQAQVSAARASLAQFRNLFYSIFTPLRAEMAAIASAQLPPIRLAGGGIGTGHSHGSSNQGSSGTGTGTVTFTGLPGAEGTTGTGNGDEDGVGGTGSTGAGSGTTTIDGTSTDTTGVGATITASNGGNGNNGVGASTGTAGTTTTGTPTV